MIVWRVVNKMLTRHGLPLVFVLCIAVSIFMTVAWVKLTRIKLQVLPIDIHYLCPSWSGRLGNQMFQYASLYGIAFNHGMTLVLRDDAELYDVFDNLFAVKVQNDSFCDAAKFWGEREPCLYDEDAFNIDTNSDIKHDSLLQSWKYFYNVEDIVREQFQFKEEIEIVCQDMVNKAIFNFTQGKSNDLHIDLQVIGVHIRRGDYLSDHNIEYGYQTATVEYLNKSMNYFREKFKRVLFLVYTNPELEDLLWRQNNVYGNDVILMPMISPDVDMCALSKCNHTIMTVGSFGWWAAWLANGITIYFEDVAKNGSDLRGDFSADMSDYFYPGWIGLS